MNLPVSREVLPSRLSRWKTALASVERRPFVALAVWTALYFAVTLAVAKTKPLWNDELFTFYISRRPTLGAVWSALLTGAEQLPPFFFVLTRAATGLVDSSPAAFRVPEMLGFWVMSICLFWFVRVRSSVAWGLVAMTFPLVTAAFEYAYEARPYALVLGFCALALCCWQTAARGRLRSLSVPGLALSIAAAVSCHYYAVLGVGAILFGESVRAINRKKLDIKVALACVLGFAPLLLFAPLILVARSYSRTFWAKPQWTSALGFYNMLLVPTPLVLLALLVLLAILYRLDFGEGKRTPSSSSYSSPVHEIAAVCAFLVIPAIGVILAKFVTGAFTFRYALPAVIGLSVVIAWSSLRLARGRSYVGTVVALILVGAFVFNGFKAYSGARSNREDHLSSYRFLSAHSAELPVVVTGPHLFFELSHQASSQQGGVRPIYLADVAMALRYTATDDVERGLLALQQWAPLDVRDFHTFCGSHDKFLIYGNTAPFEWVTKELLQEGRSLTVAARNQDELLFLVTNVKKQQQ